MTATNDQRDPLGRLRDLADNEPRVQASLDHLQRAAREMIAASRALLDVAEDMIDDPKAASGLLDLLGAVGDLAGRVARPASPSADDDDDEPPIQRIPVS